MAAQKNPIAITCPLLQSVVKLGHLAWPGTRESQVRFQLVTLSKYFYLLHLQGSNMIFLILSALFYIFIEKEIYMLHNLCYSIMLCEKINNF